MTMFTFFLALIRAIPPLERWISAVFLGYKQWRVAYDNQLMAAAVNKAVISMNTDDLNKILGEDL